MMVRRMSSYPRKVVEIRFKADEELISLINQACADRAMTRPELLKDAVVDYLAKFACDRL